MVVPTTDHLVNIENKNMNDLKKSFQDNIESYDKIIEEILDYNQYNQHKYYNTDSDEIIDFKNKYDDGSKENEKLFDLLESNTNIQKKLIDVLNKESNTLSQTYNKSADMYRNQNLINNVIEEEINVLEDRIDPLTQGVSNDKKQIEINNYYYKKNKAQINILYYFIFTCLILVLVHFLNKKLPIIFNDTIYILINGIVLVIFTIYFVNACIDILSRDSHNFDEYNININFNKNNKNIKKNEDELDYSICKVE